MLQKKTAANILKTKPFFSGRKKERKRGRRVNRNRNTLRIK